MAPKSFHRFNCAGQWCERREECRRYRIRLKREGEAGKEHPAMDWASFDIEALMVGDCVSFLPFRES